ncbi:MAG TPA: hypothetical protein ENK18_03600 [Deltaproteobacteria bacterium]|nr:hypothetical protein [Deltaproteobacteria bacterium]
MSRTVVVAAAASLLSSILTWVVLGSALAQQPSAPPPVVDVECTQLLQRPGQIDEVFVERFMSNQIAAGRKRFESVQGISTVLCAW